MSTGSRFTKSRKRHIGARGTSFLFRRLIGCCYEIIKTKCIKTVTLLKFLYLLNFVITSWLCLIGTGSSHLKYICMYLASNNTFHSYAKVLENKLIYSNI